jgi:uncharacterized cupin superfamily protein
MGEERRAFAVMPGQGRLKGLHEFEMRVKAEAGDTDGVVSVLEATEPPGFGPPIHVHHDAAEAFHVLEGEYVMHLDGEEIHLTSCVRYRNASGSSAAGALAARRSGPNSTRRAFLRT